MIARNEHRRRGIKLIVVSLMAASAALAIVARCGADETRTPTGIRLNTVGYLPDLTKRATVVGAETNVSEFAVISLPNEAVVHSGPLSAIRRHADSGENVRTADFSAFKTPGRYLLRVKGLPDSPPFRIGAGVYNASLRLNMLGFLGQRCGAPVRLEHNGVVYEKGACHLKDGFLDYYDPARAGQIKDGTGGWHDAGDYGKYTVNGAFATGILLAAWEQYGDKLAKLELPIPEADGPLPDFLAEVKFNLDWLLKMQFPDGRVSHKLTRTRFSPMIMPTDDQERRYFVSWGADATACLAAVTAKAARVYRPFDPQYADRCLEASTKAMDALRNQWMDVQPDQSAFRTGGYLKSARSDRLWALLEYWETTGDERSMRLIGQLANLDNYLFDVDWDWGEGKNLGLYVYLFSKRERNPALVEQLQQDLLGAADRIARNHDRHGYGRGLRSYYWGCNGSVARLSLTLLLAHHISGDRRYLDVVVDQLAYLYGRNPYGRSFVTGEGHNPPLFPHHRPSAADGIEAPWPGHLVGGGHPTELDWKDVLESAATNENAINWDASLAYALAAFYDPDAD
ncbi:MAG: glycoside hydrolase family 9 protein [Vicinamibacteria bacterium]|nr:glycoside hydrolase family 9 protein [Vicinamibacteria bacterium]